MKTRFQVLIGILIGLVGSAIVLATIEMRPTRLAGPPRALLSDCDGAICELVIHYVNEAAEVVGPTYRDFLRQLPQDIVVRVVCADRASFDDLRRLVEPVDCSLEPVVVGHPITTWSRDRWLALQAEEGGAATLLCPRGEKSQEAWPARRGDTQVAADLQRAAGPRLQYHRSGLYFDGGDFVADRDVVFVTPDVLLRNLQQTVADREELVARLLATFNRRVELLSVAPPHHAGMFMMAVGEQTMLVGDPLAAQRILAESATGISLPFDADFSSETAACFEAVAQQCRAAGYRVVRIPVVPGQDGRTYFTYVNVIIDQRDGVRIVYLPVFDRAGPLNEAAAAVWSQLGYEVRPVDCTLCSKHFGSLRCLVNVTSRSGGIEQGQ